MPLKTLWCDLRDAVNSRHNPITCSGALSITRSQQSPAKRHSGTLVCEEAATNDAPMKLSAFMFDGARAGVPRCVATSRGHKLVCGLIPYAVDPDAALNVATCMTQAAEPPSDAVAL